MRALKFTNANGVSVWLGRNIDTPAGTKYGVIESVSGEDQPKAEIQRTRAPVQDGATFIDSLLSEREFVISGSLLVRRDLDQIRTQRAALSAALNTKYGLGRIDYYFGGTSYTQRVLKNVAVSRVQFKNKPYQSPFQEFQITFIAHDPFWYAPDSSEQSDTVTSGTPKDMNVSGDSYTPPIIKINGPSTDPIITIRGLALSLTYTIPTSHWITIDTRFGMKTVKYDDVTNLIGKIAIGSVFAPMLPGINAVTLSGGGTALLRWIPRYIGV